MRTPALVIMCLALLGCGGPRVRESQARRDLRYAERLQPDDIVTLNNDQLADVFRDDEVWVYTDEAAYEAGLELARAKDEAGLKRLLANRRAFKVGPSTRARVLQGRPGVLRAEIRILDGPMKGR